MSLRLRIIIIYALLVLASFSLVIRLIISDVRPRYLEAVEESMVDTAEVIAAFLSEQITENGLRTDTISASMAEVEQRRFTARIYGLTKRKVSLRIYVTDNKGKLVYDSTGRDKPGADYSQWRDVLLTLRGEYGARSTRADQNDPSSSVLFVAAPIIKNAEIAGVVSIGKPSNSIAFLISIAQRRFVLSLALVGLTAVMLSIVLSIWITRPLQRLCAYAAGIRQGEKHPLPRLGSPELRRLGQALEEMQTRLEGKNYIEDYVRALTHELKSPLTGIKGAGEILREQVTDPQGLKFLDNIDAEAERMRSLVERMLQLSRLENVRSIYKTTFDAGQFFTGLADSFNPQIAAKNLHLELDIQKKLHLQGDELLLRQAIANLLANSIDFAPSGSTMAITALRKQNKALITVRDQGPGIPDFAKDKVFDKFFSLSRPDTGKKSSGLGLPFVAEVLNLHNGSITLTPATPGLEAVITLPAE